MKYEGDLRTYAELTKDEQLCFSEIYYWFFWLTKRRFLGKIKRNEAKITELLNELNKPAFEVSNEYWDLCTTSECYVKDNLKNPPEEFRYLLATARIAGTFAAAMEAIESDFDSHFPEIKIKTLKK